MEWRIGLFRGKDSKAMLNLLIKLGYPLDEVESVRNQTVYDAHGIEMYIGENNIFICTGFLFDKPFNEENYTEACRLIKKLFIGE